MLGALVAAAVVFAPGQARLVPPVAGVIAGKPAIASVLVTGRRPRTLPRVRFVLDGTIVTAIARAATPRGRYTVRFTLPFGGSWSHQIRIAGRVAGSGHTEVLVESRLPGADARAICGEAGAFWPTETLAIDFGTPWIACKGSGSLLRLEPRKRIRFGGSAVIAVATGFGSVWALDGSRSGTLIRIDPATNAVLAQSWHGSTSAPQRRTTCGKAPARCGWRATRAPRSSASIRRRTPSSGTSPSATARPISRSTTRAST